MIVVLAAGPLNTTESRDDIIGSVGRSILRAVATLATSLAVFTAGSIQFRIGARYGRRSTTLHRRLINF